MMQVAAYANWVIQLLLTGLGGMKSAEVSETVHWTSWRVKLDRAGGGGEGGGGGGGEGEGVGS